jgi:hypothetical protein
MIKNADILKKFEIDFIRRRPELSLKEKFSIMDGMWSEGINLGVIPSSEPLEGLDVDIRIAEVLNSCLKKSLSG